MDLSSIITDNVTEVLVKIIEFTERRHEILTHNVVELRQPGFLPKDLDAAGFADLMMEGISEHVRNERLVLCDSENIKFGADGSFESLPIVDETAMELLRNDTRDYLRLQIQKLSENTLNNMVATELLRQKQIQNRTLNN